MPKPHYNKLFGIANVDEASSVYRLTPEEAASKLAKSRPINDIDWNRIPAEMLFPEKLSIVI